MIQLFGLIRETFLEAVSRKIVIGCFIIAMLALVGIVLYFTSSGMHDVIQRLRPTPADPDGAALRELVRSVQTGIGQIFYTAAIFLSIFVTAGIVPGMMEKGSIDLLLSKPLSRTTLLLGKVLGGLLMVVIGLLFFILATWLIISLATGIWNIGFLASLLPILLAFISLYAILVFIGITTQSAALGMIVCYLLATVVSLVLMSREQFLFQFVQGAFWQKLITGLYYITPQFSDLREIASDLIQNKSTASFPSAYINAIGLTIVFFAASALVFRKKEF